MQANHNGTNAGLSIAEYMKKRFWEDLGRPVTPGTRALYEAIVRNYFAPIVHLRVDDITGDVLTNFARHIATLQLTAKMQRNVLSTLKIIVRTAAKARDVTAEGASR